jgi:hypothetical protein
MLKHWLFHHFTKIKNNCDTQLKKGDVFRVAKNPTLWQRGELCGELKYGRCVYASQTEGMPPHEYWGEGLKWSG